MQSQSYVSVKSNSGGMMGIRISARGLIGWGVCIIDHWAHIFESITVLFAHGWGCPRQSKIGKTAKRKKMKPPLLKIFPIHDCGFEPLTDFIMGRSLIVVV